MGVVTAAAVGLALLVLAVVAVSAGTRQDSAGSQQASGDAWARRSNGGPVGVFVASLAYLVVLTPVVAPDGINLPTAVLLLVVAALPAVISGLFSRARHQFGDAARRLYDVLAVIVAFALLVGLLASVAAFTSLMGDVNRYLATAVVGLAVGAYLVARGRASASRTSRWTLVVAFLLPVLLVGLGGAVSDAGTIISPLVPTTEVSLGTALAMICAAVGLGFVDPAIGLIVRGAPRPSKVASWGSVIVAAFVLTLALGLILVYGGGFVAPSLQAFLLAAAPAIAIGVFIFIIVYVIASAADTQLAAATEVATGFTAPSNRVRVTILIVVVAVVVAMFVPATGQIVAVAALLAATGFGALLPAVNGGAPKLRPAPAMVVGLAAGIVIAVLMGLPEALSFQGATAVALIVGFLLSGTASFVLAKRPQPEPIAAA